MFVHESTCMCVCVFVCVSMCMCVYLYEVTVVLRASVSICVCVGVCVSIVTVVSPAGVSVAGVGGRWGRLPLHEALQPRLLGRAPALRLRHCRGTRNITRHTHADQHTHAYTHTQYVFLTHAHLHLCITSHGLNDVQYTLNTHTQS